MSNTIVAICFPPKFPVHTWLCKRLDQVDDEIYQRSVLHPLVDHFKAIDEVVSESVTGAIVLGSGVELQDLHIRRPDACIHKAFYFFTTPDELDQAFLGLNQESGR